MCDLTDDLDHTVRKFTLDGQLLQTLGKPNHPSDTGYDKSAPGSLRTITRLAFIPRAEFWMCTVSRHWNVDRADPR